VGSDALLVEVDSTDEAAALYAAARERGVLAVEIVPAARTVLFDGVDDPDALAQTLAGWELQDIPAPETGPVVELPTRYDGPDLEVVANLWSTDVAGVVATHTSLTYRVDFCGFAPGFPYCSGLPPELSVPRRADPRPQVPAGSVAVAGTYTGIYPQASPGGWLLLGATEVPVWDLARENPALLAPGRLLRFVEVTS
jgi:KipI family sensor histidine kinase inhibitor